MIIYPLRDGLSVRRRYERRAGDLDDVRLGFGRYVGVFHRVNGFRIPVLLPADFDAAVAALCVGVRGDSDRRNDCGGIHRRAGICTAGTDALRRAAGQKNADRLPAVGRRTDAEGKQHLLQRFPPCGRHQNAGQRFVADAGRRVIHDLELSVHNVRDELSGGISVVHAAGKAVALQNADRILAVQAVYALCRAPAVGQVIYADRRRGFLMLAEARAADFERLPFLKDVFDVLRAVQHPLQHARGKLLRKQVGLGDDPRRTDLRHIEHTGDADDDLRQLGIACGQGGLPERDLHLVELLDRRLAEVYAPVRRKGLFGQQRAAAVPADQHVAAIPAGRGRIENKRNAERGIRSVERQRDDRRRVERTVIAAEHRGPVRLGTAAVYSAHAVQRPDVALQRGSLRNIMLVIRKHRRVGKRGRLRRGDLRAVDCTGCNVPVEDGGCAHPAPPYDAGRFCASMGIKLTLISPQ